MRAASQVLVSILALLLIGCGSYQFRGSLIEPADPAPDVRLPTSDGTIWRLSDQQGKVVVMFFGFTTCPDICPTTLADLAAVRKQLGADAEKLEIVLITVDPERDTNERLTRYLAQFDAGAIALRGEPDQLEPIYAAYGVFAAKRELPDSALGYTMDHTSSMFVIDPQGRWRALLPYGSPIADIVGDLRFLLR